MLTVLASLSSRGLRTAMAAAGRASGLPGAFLSQLATKSRVRPVWHPMVAPAPTTITPSNAACSRYGGPAALKQEEKHPQCGTCKRDLDFMFQVNMKSIPHAAQQAFGDDGVVQLFFCTACSPSDPADSGILARRIEPKQLQLASTEFSPAKEITGWAGGAHEVPSSVEEEDADSESTEAALSLSASGVAHQDAHQPDSSDKLGGWPAWVQGEEYPCCSECQKKMRLLFQTDLRFNNFMLGDMGVGHVFFCSEHRTELVFSWACY